MNTPDEEKARVAMAKRKPWIYRRPETPGLTALFRDGKSRSVFIRYWITDNIWNTFDVIGHFAIKLLPMDLCSRLGAMLGPYAVSRFHPVAERRARATIASLRPDLSPAEQDALFQENSRNQGRLISEFSVIERLRDHSERMELHHPNWIVEAAREGPVIFVGMHLGNWEIGPIILSRAGLHPYISYTPPHGRAKAWIANRVRRNNGLNFLPPGIEGVRPMVRVLKEGGVISMFCDEGFNGRIRGPLFGRPPNLEGNLALAVRLARMTGAPIYPWYSLRTRDLRFKAIGLAPLRFPTASKADHRLEEDIQRLNSVIEPIILAHLDQWYFLDNEL